MPRLFPRAAESAVRFLKAICDDPDQSVQMRARSAELILAAYGLADLQPDRTTRHQNLKGLVKARLELSGIDRKIAGKVRRSTNKSEQRRINKILKDENWKQ